MPVVVFGAMVTAQARPLDDFHCPETYATDAEREAAVKVFAENFAKQHPKATVNDLVAERYRLLIAHDCRQTLANITASRGSEKAAQIVSPQTQNLALAGRKFTRVDEYYDGTTRVWTVIFVDDPEHPESYANQVNLNFYDWTPKPTAEGVATALGHEQAGRRNIFLFKARGETEGAMVYQIVSVTCTKGGTNWVNVMRVEGWEESVANIDFSHRLGVGTDFDKAEVEARQWLLSTEGESLRDAAAALRIGAGWPEHLERVK